MLRRSFLVILSNFLLLPSLLLSLISPLTAANPTSLPSLVQVINLGQNNVPEGMVVSEQNNRAYVSTSFPGRVIVINTENNTAQATIALNSERPTSIKLNTQTNRLYTTNSIIDESLSVVDTSTNRVVTAIPIGKQPESVAVNVRTGRVYVGNIQQPYNITVINGATNTVITRIPAGNHPVALAVNETTNRIYAANYSDSTISVIDGSNNTIITNITVGNRPRSLSIDERTNTVYVANWGVEQVTVIDGESNNIKKAIALPGNTLAVAVNPAINRLYATFQSDKDGMVVIDTQTYDIIGTPLEVDYLPIEVQVNTLTGRIYVASQFSSVITVFQDNIAGDTDGDSLLDVWEVNGLDVNRDGIIDLPLHQAPYNADPYVKDVFVEIDFMTGQKPLQQALDDVIRAFRNAPIDEPRGINLHLLVDEDVPLVANLRFVSNGLGIQDSFDDIKLGGGNNFPGNQDITCGTDATDAHFGTVQDRISDNVSSPNPLGHEGLRAAVPEHARM